MPSKEAHYDIELATALHEANMSRLQHVVETFLDGPDARNGHVARAVETVYDDIEVMMSQSMERLVAAVLAVYDDLDEREVPESNGRWAEELVLLVRRFGEHMNANFDRGKPITAKAVFYTITTTARSTHHALQTLHGEILTRPKGDTVAEAYRQALLETAEFPPGAAAAVANLEREKLDDRMRRHLNAAKEDMRESARIVEYHRNVIAG